MPLDIWNDCIIEFIKECLPKQFKLNEDELYVTWESIAEKIMRTNEEFNPTSWNHLSAEQKLLLFQDSIFSYQEFVAAIEEGKMMYLNTLLLSQVKKEEPT